MSASFKAVVNRDAFLKRVGRVYRVIARRNGAKIELARRGL